MLTCVDDKQRADQQQHHVATGGQTISRSGARLLVSSHMRLRGGNSVVNSCCVDGGSY